MSFHEGQRVVCVDAEDTHTWGVVELVKNAVYTIRWEGEYDGTYCVRLREIADRPVFILGTDIVKYRMDYPFRASRFRPIAVRSTEAAMARLRQICAEHKAPVREKALSSLSSFRVTGTNI